MQHFIEAQHAAEMVGLAVYGRAILGRAIEDEPEVVSLRVSVTHQTSGLAVIEWEVVGRNGLALGGGWTVSAVCVVWWQSAHQHGPEIRAFRSHRKMCCYLQGFLSQPHSQCLDFTADAVQVA